MARITLQDDLESASVKLAQGNPGAIVAMFAKVQMKLPAFNGGRPVE